jgi:hypothetical protein
LGAKLQGLRYKVKFIAAQHVKPFVTNQKNDANDALAICESAFDLEYISSRASEVSSGEQFKNGRQISA